MNAERALRPHTSGMAVDPSASISSYNDTVPIAGFLQDRNKSKWLASLAYPWVQLVDKFVGEKVRAGLSLGKSARCICTTMQRGMLA